MSTGIGDKRRFIAVVAAVIAAGFGGASFLAFFAARDAVRSSIESGALPAAADSVYAQIRTDLVKPIFVSSTIAHDTFLHNWSADGERDLAAIKAYLGEIAKQNDALTAFFVSEDSRRYYCPDGILKVVSPDAWRDTWYFRVRSMKDPYELNVDIDMAHRDELTIFVNYRVINRQGRYIGAAGIGIAVSTLRDMIRKYRSDYDTSIYLADSLGRIVAGAPYGYENAPPPRLDSDPRLGEASVKAIADRGGSFRYVHGRETVLTRVIWLPELSWYVFVEKPEGAAISLARRALWLNIGLMALVLALVISVSGLTIDRFQSRLERAASYDPLTGALNRLAFKATADQAVKAARRSGLGIAAVIFDIDDFKKVNDELGHPAGDAVLVCVVRSAVSAIRASDPICRWGGEEFLVLLAGCSVEDAAVAAEKIRAAIRAGTAADSPREVSVSAGIAAIDGGALKDRETDAQFDELVARADEALLEAKRGGKDRTVIA